MEQTESQDGFEWAQQPLTVALRKQLLERRKSALAEWAALSEKSSDPRVAAAFERYQSAKRVMVEITKLAGKGEDEE